MNKIYLYDDRITITYNSGDEPVTISDQLLSELEEKDEKDKVLFKNGSGPPNKNRNFDTMCQDCGSFLFAPIKF